MLVENDVTLVKKSCYRDCQSMAKFVEVKKNVCESLKLVELSCYIMGKVLSKNTFHL